MLKISFDNRIYGRKCRLFSITDSIDKNRAQLVVASRHSTHSYYLLTRTVWQFTVLASSERSTDFYDAHSLSSSRLARGRNDRDDVDCSIKVTSAVRRAVLSVPRDRDMTRNTRQSPLCRCEKGRCAKTIEDNGESDFTYKERVARARSHAYVRSRARGMILVNPRLLHACCAYRECVHKCTWIKELRKYSYDIVLWECQ